MATKIFKCFIASPSDTNGEREICDKVFIEINKSIGEAFSFRIEPLKWETDIRPSFGREGQDVINTQIGNDYELFVGIMYKKFGSPTSKAGSGTEEEFNNAYARYKNKDHVEIMFYFNDEPPQKLSDVIPNELEKVNSFKSKVAGLGGLYCSYNGPKDFEDKLRQHFNKYFIEKYGTVNGKENNKIEYLTNKEVLKKIFKKRLEDALTMFSTQPLIWVDPVLSSTNEISQNPDDNYNNRITIEHLLNSPASTIIKSPPQFGLTSLAHHLVLEAWEKDNLWIYLDSDKTKPHNIHNAVKNEAEALGCKVTDIKCIILDSWSSYENASYKKLKNLSEAYKEIPIIVMQTIDDSKFFNEEVKEQIEINRDFEVLHLLALPRNQIRKVVSEYNKVKEIADEDIVLAKILSDLEALNIHRTPHNCLTLLKVSEKYFDESPVNRTKMLEMVLFILFDMDGIPTYKIKPDLKDCEYVLGRFCENLIRNSIYDFTREKFLEQLKAFCTDKLIDLEVEVVFDVLTANSIIVKRDFNFIFRSSYWIFYFAAKRMHGNKVFCDYIFESKKYISFPEIIEFYTGIDRNRSDALKILCNDIKETCDIVFNKVGMPDNINPFIHTQWKPTQEHIEKMTNEIGENVLNSRLPESVKDQYADRSYNQIRPYNQNIQTIFEQYSLHNLMQKIRASSRALRNSDYVEPEIKKQILQEILRSWEQLSKVLFALTPILATKGSAEFEGAGFELSGDFGDTFEERVKRIIFVNPTNVVGIFKEDLYSAKLGPLLFDHFIKETSPIKKHHLALLLIFERPREWKKHIEAYIVSLHKNSFFLHDTVNALRTRYRYAFLNDTSLRECEYLIKLGLAKHHFGDKKPGLDKIRQIKNENLPKREYDNDTQ